MYSLSALTPKVFTTPHRLRRCYNNVIGGIVASYIIFAPMLSQIIPAS